MKKTSGKLSIKILTFVLVLTLIGYAGVGAFSYMSYKNELTKNFDSSALSMSNMVISSIKSEEVQKYDTTGQKDDYYNTLQQLISDFKKNTGAKFAYIITDTGTGFKYIVDGYVEGQTVEQSNLGDTDGYGSYCKEAQDAFKTGLPKTSAIYFANSQYGYLISAFLPIKDSQGKTVAVMGVDLNPQSIFDAVNSYLVYIISILVIVEAVTLILMAVMIRKIITKRINALTMVAEGISEGNTDFTIDMGKSTDELGILARSFQRTLEAVKGLVSDVNMLVGEALEGRLKTRADASKQNGDYKKIIEGINATLDAVTAPINESAKVLSEVAKGNLGVRVTGDFKGEHAIIKDALNSTIDTLKGYISEISQTLGAIANNDLTSGITSEYEGDFVELKDSINSIVYSLNNIISEINTSSNQVATGTAQLSEDSKAISAGATEQASSIEELTSTVTQIAAQTRQNAENANKANELSASIKEGAARGNEKMENMQKAMEDINGASENIGRIIKVIDDIAFQTNILALNAAVEAARAGIHGKGFAVVAEEVGNLAAKSADAAKETTALIEASTEKTVAGAAIANETMEALKTIVSGVDESGHLIDEIAVASNEQAIGIEQVNQGIEQLSQVVQTNSATAQESAAASEELSSQTELLKSMVGKFKLKD